MAIHIHIANMYKVFSLSISGRVSYETLPLSYETSKIFSGFEIICLVIFTQNSSNLQKSETSLGSLLFELEGSLVMSLLSNTKTILLFLGDKSKRKTSIFRLLDLVLNLTLKVPLIIFSFLTLEF